MRVPGPNSHTNEGVLLTILYPVEVCHLKPIRMHEGGILFICYKQPVLIDLGNSNNVDKTAEDPPWWP